jgi:cell division protein FtsX
MKAMDLLLMVLTFNILFVIISSIGCYSTGHPFTILDFGTTAFVALLGVGLGVTGFSLGFLKPIGATFFAAFLTIWTINVNNFNTFIQFTDKVPWLLALLILVGGIIGILGAIELQTGVRL